MMDSRGHGSRGPFAAVGIRHADWGLIGRSSARRPGAGSWGLAHRNVTREYSESICSLEGLLASGLKERVEDHYELEPATTAKSGC